jgi:hypothetical protein
VLAHFCELKTNPVRVLKTQNGYAILRFDIISFELLCEKKPKGKQAI